MNYSYFFRKLGKMLQNLSSAAVKIGALRVNKIGRSPEDDDTYQISML